MKNEITNKERVLTNLLKVVEKQNLKLNKEISELKKENEMLNNLFNGSIKKVSEQNKLESEIIEQLNLDFDDYIIKDFSIVDFIIQDYSKRADEGDDISGVIIRKKYAEEVLKHPEVYLHEGEHKLFAEFNMLTIEFADEVDGCDYGFIG